MVRAGYACVYTSFGKEYAGLEDVLLKEEAAAKYSFLYRLA